MAATDYFSCEGFEIKIKSALKEGEEFCLFKQHSAFRLPKNSIYALRGPNRSGKSLLIQMMLGALPPSVTTGDPRIFLEGQSRLIRRISDAYAAGIFAVFQKDNLISTMTVREQIVLRHCTARSKGLLANLKYRALESIIGKFRYFFPIEEVAEKITKWLPAHEVAFPQLRVIHRAEKMFPQLGLSLEVMEMYPEQLSGGTRARVKLASVLLSENIKLLFLDEALDGVEEYNYEALIRIIKEDARRRGYALVVVTHSSSEFSQWQPSGELQIQDHEVRLDEYGNADAIESPLMLPEEPIKKFFALEHARAYLKALAEPVVVFLDNHCKDNKQVGRLLQMLPANRIVVEVDTTEATKTLADFSTFAQRHVALFPRAQGTMVLVGGGVKLNFCSQFAAMVHRGIIPHIVIPTTVMAVADVAIGSKASLNVTASSPAGTRKHVLGTYTNPAAVICDSEFLSSLPPHEIKIGLSEVLKHGLLQDADLYQKTCALLAESKPDLGRTYACALQAQYLKGRILAADPLETGVGRILLHGHLHAHNLERLTNFTHSHGIAVMWGLLLDAALGPDRQLAATLATVIKVEGIAPEIRKICVYLEVKKNLDLLEKVYCAEARYQLSRAFDKYTVVEIPEVGYYGSDPKSLKIREVGWADIVAAIKSTTTLFK